MMTESEIKMYSIKYSKMREHSVFCFGGSFFDYDNRNSQILKRFKNVVESKSGLKITTTNNIEMQCLRYLAMRELAYRNEQDGNKKLNVEVDDIKRKDMNAFDELADNPYYFHPLGIREDYHTASMIAIQNSRDKSNKTRADAKRSKDEAKITIN